MQFLFRVRLDLPLLAAALKYLCRSQRVRLYFLLMPPLMISTCYDLLRRYGSAHWLVMFWVIFCLLAAGPIITGPIALNLFGSYQTGLTRVGLFPDGLYRLGRASSCICLAVAGGITIVIWKSFAVIGAVNSDRLGLSILMLALSANAIFTSAGFLTSVLTPRKTDNRSVNGLDAYSFMGHVVSTVYLLLCMVLALSASRLGRWTNSWPTAAFAAAVLVTCGWLFGKWVKTMRQITVRREQCLLQVITR